MIVYLVKTNIRESCSAKESFTFTSSLRQSTRWNQQRYPS